MWLRQRRWLCISADVDTPSASEMSDGCLRKCASERFAELLPGRVLQRPETPRENSDLALRGNLCNFALEYCHTAKARPKGA